MEQPPPWPHLPLSLSSPWLYLTTSSFLFLPACLAAVFRLSLVCSVSPLLSLYLCLLCFRLSLTFLFSLPLFLSHSVYLFFSVSLFVSLCFFYFLIFFVSVSLSLSLHLLLGQGLSVCLSLSRRILTWQEEGPTLLDWGVRPPQGPGKRVVVEEEGLPRHLKGSSICPRGIECGNGAGEVVQASPILTPGG